MNTRKLGAVAVAKAIAWFTQSGYNVSIPVSETQRYDLIVEKDSICYRVEVKSSINDEVMLRTLGGNRSWGGVSSRLTTEDAEYLYAVTRNGEFLVPLAFVNNKATIKPHELYRVN